MGSGQGRAMVSRGMSIFLISWGLVCPFVGYLPLPLPEIKMFLSAGFDYLLLMVVYDLS